MRSGSPRRFLGPNVAGTILFDVRAWATGLVCLLCVAVPGVVPDPAWGQFSSGGYSRPGGGFKSYSAPVRRSPAASSGGYYRRAPAAPFPGYSSGSPSDRAMSRGRSSEALRDYRASQRPPDTYTRRSPAGSGAQGWGPFSGWAATETRRPPVGGGRWGGGPVARPSYPGTGTGILTGIALWAALNGLSQPGQAEYFYTNRKDPAYREWRREAEQRAERDPEVAAKLRQLDERLAQLDRDPGSASWTPGQTPGAPVPSDEGSGAFWPVLIIGGGALVLFWLWRRRAAAPAARPASSAGLAGSEVSRLRVGMVLPVDPAPFLLAGGLTKIQPPEESGTVSVESIGLLRYGDVRLHRLYLPGGRTYFQLHLGRDGRPDECRYFSILDEVNPAHAQEWAFWLDPVQGVIGWPSFQTKDGKVYGRVWAPGNARVPPRQIDETLQHLDRVEERRLQAMLYGAPTGGAPPAPATEYILVCAIEAGGQAWVQIDAGIDINPATLNLPDLPLAA